MSERKLDPWECRACTWVNENEHGLACLMCQTERRIAAPQTPRNKGGAARASASDLNAPDAVKKPVSRRKDFDLPQSAARHRDESFHSRLCDESERPAQLPRGEDLVAQSSENVDTSAGNETETKKTTKGGNEKWNAFASLESNYQSSDDEGSDEDVDHSDGGREGSDHESGNGNRKMGNYAGGNEWDAFKSLEQNYQSSEEEHDSGSDENSEESEGGMEKNGHCERERDNYPSLNKKNGKKFDPGVAYVDLVCSDEDSVCDLDVNIPGKENKKTGRQNSKRKRPEPYTLDGDSESSLSEVESRRPLPSPSARPMPPWQRRQSAPTPIRMNENLKTSNSFSCMNGRNDVIGGSGAGVNGFRFSQIKGDDSKATTAKTKSRRSSSTSAASGANSRRSSKSASTASKPKKRKSIRSKPSAASKAGTPAKTGRKRTYKKSSKRPTRGRKSSTGGRASNNNAWNTRERGIRQPYRRGSGESAPYMAITKQEPVLRNVGGASIQF